MWESGRMEAGARGVCVGRVDWRMTEGVRRETCWSSR